MAEKESDDGEAVGNQMAAGSEKEAVGNQLERRKL